MYRVNVLDNNQSSKVQQIVHAFMQDMDRGALKKGEKLPSINIFSEQNGVARDTIERAYRQLRNRGYIASYPGRGYFVVGKREKQLKVLLVFNKLSSFKKIIYDAIVEGLGPDAKVDLSIHHYSPRLLREILESHLGHYDYYAIMPHFQLGVRSIDCHRILRIIPIHQLVLLDKQLQGLEDTVNGVYQDFENDIYKSLQQSSSLFRKYNGITLVLPEGTHHPQEIITGIEQFCREQELQFRIKEEVRREELKKHTVYIVTEEDDLAHLIKKIRRTSWVLGHDIGIISFNDTVFKELLDITVVTTDFEAMGRTAARLLLGKEKGAHKNPFYTLHRGSL